MQKMPLNAEIFCDICRNLEYKSKTIPNAFGKIVLGCSQHNSGPDGFAQFSGCTSCYYLRPSGSRDSHCLFILSLLSSRNKLSLCSICLSRYVTLSLKICGPRFTAVLVARTEFPFAYFLTFKHPVEDFVVWMRIWS